MYVNDVCKSIKSFFQIYGNKANALLHQPIHSVQTIDGICEHKYSDAVTQWGK